jgi:hypothetical protein
MGVKLQIYNNRICIQYDSILNGKKTKSFKMNQQDEALTYANSLDERYVEFIAKDILAYAKKNNHPFMKYKDWSFV